MREAKKIRLRHAYFGPLTLREIARENAVGDKFLERFWRDEKAAGRIANVARPHFAKFCKPVEPPPAPVEAVIATAPLADDEAPIGEPNRVCSIESSALLDALRKHHGRDTAAVHETPADWLRFDAKGMPAPSHVMLMRMCRVRDALCELARIARVPHLGVPA